MNALPIMEVALKHVLTLLDHSPVVVTLGTVSTMMECPVMVCIHACILYYKVMASKIDEYNDYL